MGFGFLFTYLPSDLQKQILDRAEKDSEFALGLGIYLGFRFIPVGKEFQVKNHERAEENPEFAGGFGIWNWVRIHISLS
jgi:hypothetical protein